MLFYLKKMLTNVLNLFISSNDNHEYYDYNSNDYMV